MVVIGSGFAGSTATLSFLEATEKAGQVGSVALIEAGKKGTWPGGSRWSNPFLRLNRDNTLSRDRAERVEEGLSDLDYWRKLAGGASSRARRRTPSSSCRTTASS